MRINEVSFCSWFSSESSQILLSYHCLLKGPNQTLTANQGTLLLSGLTTSSYRGEGRFPLFEAKTLGTALRATVEGG